MPPLDRFTVSLDTELLAAFDGFLAARGYVNRSEVIRDLIRDALLSETGATSHATAVTVITLVCDIKSEAAPSRIRAALIEADGLRPTISQVPIDESQDLWVITARGSGGELNALAGCLRAIRGVSGVEQITNAVREDARCDA